MRATIALLPLAALASSALGCGATVEVPRICFTEPGLTVPGSPTGGSVSSPSFFVDITNDIPLLRTNNSDTDLRVDTVTITPTSGSPDLSGVQTAVVRVQPPSGSSVDLVQYQRNPGAPAPSAIVLGGDTVNVAPYLDSGRAALSFTLTGQPPRTDWTANVETCLHGQSTASP
jgi:hypothetical protein